jgi:REP-associated tyrosine transposase
MARPLRIEYPGAVYHITSRGNARNMIFDDDEDRERFLVILASVVKRHRWFCHAFCLMGNHYHLLIETPDGNLSRGMRQFNGIVTQSHNRRHNRTGHLFQGRFKAILLEKDAHLLELCRYIVLNPVAANMVKTPEDWPWSSFLPTAGLAPVPDLLTVDWLLGRFSEEGTNARKRYVDFVYDGLGKKSPWEALRGGLLLGSDAFVEALGGKMTATEQEVPLRQRLAHRPGLDDLLNGRTGRMERAEGAYVAHVEWGYTLKEVGEFLGMHYATVSKMVKEADTKWQGKTCPLAPPFR